MGKRLGRKRLYALEKKGQSNSNKPAAGMTDAIGHTKVSRDGQQITTEITIDLGSSKYAGGGLIQCATANAVIGSGSTAHLGQITTAVNGIVTEVELICLETPTGAVTGSDIDVSYGTGSTGVYSSSAGMTSLLASAGENLAIGYNVVTDVDDNALVNKYLYLTNGFATSTHPHLPTTDQGNATAFSAGKLVLRLYGYAVPDDI
tara:strand:- start:12 stop:623 length:612 start_codon:yes stop_codon:yes gene_type:complete